MGIEELKNINPEKDKKQDDRPIDYVFSARFLYEFVPFFFNQDINEVIANCLNDYCKTNENFILEKKDSPLKHEYGHGGRDSASYNLLHMNNESFQVEYNYSYDTFNDDSEDGPGYTTIDILATGNKIKELYDDLTRKLKGFKEIKSFNEEVKVKMGR